MGCIIVSKIYLEAENAAANIRKIKDLEVSQMETIKFLYLPRTLWMRVGFGKHHESRCDKSRHMEEGSDICTWRLCNGILLCHKKNIILTLHQNR